MTKPATHLATLIIAAASGLVFGLGLMLAGMANPAKVLAFLNVAGPWDPSLALVMGGAIMIGVIAFTVAKKHDRSLLGFHMHWPTARFIDKRLVLGSSAFGAGWGLCGICPGPALVLLGAETAKGLVFVGAMLAGMGLFEIVESFRASPARAPAKATRE